MTHLIGRTFVREKRRLYFVTLAAFYSGAAFYSHYNIQLFGLPFPMVMAAIYASATGLSALIVCAFVPRLAMLLEPLALSRLFLALFVFAHPVQSQAILDYPIVMACLVVAGGLFISRATRRPEEVLLRQAA